MAKQANYRRSNLRELPAYSVAEVAHYLNIPRSTVRYWATGKDSSPALDPRSMGSDSIDFSAISAKAGI